MPTHEPAPPIPPLDRSGACRPWLPAGRAKGCAGGASPGGANRSGAAARAPIPPPLFTHRSHSLSDSVGAQPGLLIVPGGATDRKAGALIIYDGMCVLAGQPSWPRKDRQELLLVAAWIVCCQRIPTALGNWTPSTFSTHSRSPSVSRASRRNDHARTDNRVSRTNLWDGSGGVLDWYVRAASSRCNAEGERKAHLLHANTAHSPLAPGRPAQPCVNQAAQRETSTRCRARG
jgi:hypothetical protein